MQLSEKDKRALQEKYKAQRQAMWSGKQSTPQESDEKAEEADQTDAVANTADSTDTESLETQSDSSSMTEDQPVSMDTSDQQAGQDASSIQTESDAETAAIAEDAEELQEEEEETSAGERVFWEEDQEGGPSFLTWKLVVAVIGISIVLVGVGVYLGFLFAG